MGIEDAFTITIVVDCIEVFGVLCAYFIVDKFGRRPLLLYSATAMTIFLLIVGALGVSTPSFTRRTALTEIGCRRMERLHRLSPSTPTSWRCHRGFHLPLRLRVQLGLGSAGLGRRCRVFGRTKQTEDHVHCDRLFLALRLGDYVYFAVLVQPG